MLQIVGGVYREYCMRPQWQEIYGSAGRAASAIAKLGGEATLHTYLAPCCTEALQARAAFDGFSVRETATSSAVSFSYIHPLATPAIQRSSEKLPPIFVSGGLVIRFGMLEGTAVVDAEYAVYDPQDVQDPEAFHKNGSKARHLAIVLNRYEASKLSGVAGTEAEMAHIIAATSGAEVVIIKAGPRGALVVTAGTETWVPAFETDQVWKIGSGDCFVATFGYCWMEKRLSPIDAAQSASRATAYYCATRGFASSVHLTTYNPRALKPAQRYLDGYRPVVYLAGPFFSLAQLWLVEQARGVLTDMGLKVFSPYHDVGHGSAEDVVEMDLNGIRDCDAVLAIGDGLDSGTIYEVGYARAIGKPVVFYAENESREDKKMMQGSDCIICDDFATAMYRTLWAAAQQ
jgi:nucleoside 2-deoxyribosyltransferase